LPLASPRTLALTLLLLAPHFSQVGVKVPLVVRLEGTNVEEGKEILANSDVAIISASDLDDAATKAVASLA
jgi:succinyl-CoA synthetase beta subunit